MAPTQRELPSGNIVSESVSRLGDTKTTVVLSDRTSTTLPWTWSRSAPKDRWTASNSSTLMWLADQTPETCTVGNEPPHTDRDAIVEIWMFGKRIWEPLPPAKPPLGTTIRRCRVMKVVKGTSIKKSLDAGRKTPEDKVWGAHPETTVGDKIHKQINQVTQDPEPHNGCRGWVRKDINIC